MTLEQFKKKASQLPDGPGVYFFLGPRREVLYIGKATSLRDRVRSYFAKDLMDTRGPLLVDMLEKARSVDCRVTDSVLEALLLEAALIRSHKPRYNTDLKDDKSYNHVVITKEDFPQVLLVRGKELEQFKAETKPYKIFGPFPHGMQLREALRIIRKIFPYRDTKCVPCAEQLAKGKAICRPCFNRSIGLCPGVCTGEVGKAEYKRTIRHLVLLFEGKKKQLSVALEREMRAAAKAERFEEAARLRGQLGALRHIQDVSLIKEEYRGNAAGGSRIEAYDVAHMRGAAAVGVMVVVEEGEARPEEYRKFRIKTAKAGDDAGALKEILSRRLGHDEWPLPRIIAVDGSTAQMNAAKAVLSSYGIGIPVVGVTKDERHRPRALQGDRVVIKDRERALLLANAEAHRFAIGYHRRSFRQSAAMDSKKPNRRNLGI